MNEDNLFYERWLRRREQDEEAGLPVGETPIEIWAPAFSWYRDFTIENCFEVGRQGRCKLCELDVTGSKEEHVEAHRQERELWNRYRQSVPKPPRRSNRVGERLVERESFESWLVRNGESRRITGSRT